jgi:hypothetical protein
MSSIRDQIIHNINKYGHMVIGVGGDATTASFAYTIGLTSKFNCELLLCGLPWQHAHPILNHIVSEFSEELLDVPTEKFTNLPVLLKTCDHDLDRLHGEYVVQADHFYGKRVNVVQVILSDRDGRLPMNPEFNQHYMANFQPLFVSAFKKLPVV